MRKHHIDDKEALRRYYLRCIYDVAIALAKGNKRLAKATFTLIAEHFAYLVKVHKSMYHAKQHLFGYYSVA